MIKHFMKIAVSSALLMAASSVVSTASAQSVMQQCSVKYQAAKSANTLGGATWGTFLKQCRATTTATPAAATAPAAPVAATPIAASAGPTKSQCNTNYKSAKAAGTMGGATKKAYLAQCMTGSAAPAAKPVAEAPVAMPTAATAAVAPAAGAKPVSAGRAAETTRIRACAGQWKANKPQLIAATPGLTWPKYWSACNKQMKAAGK